MPRSFSLPDDFVEPYAALAPPFGFNGLGEAVYLRTYSRLRPDGSKERWTDTVRRVVEGTYSIQKDHITKNALGWNEDHGLASAREMFDHLWHLRWTPPGRGLWSMGTPIIDELGLGAALNNCFPGSTRVYFGGPRGIEVATFSEIFKAGAAAAVAGQCDKSHPFTVKVVAGDGVLRDATVRVVPSAHNLVRIVLSAEGLEGFSQSGLATVAHRWILADGTVTTTLKAGDTLQPTPAFPRPLAAGAPAGSAEASRAKASAASAAGKAFPEDMLPPPDGNPVYTNAWCAAAFSLMRSAATPVPVVSTKSLQWLTEMAPLHGYMIFDSEDRSSTVVCRALAEVGPLVVKSVTLAGSEDMVFCFSEPVTGSFVLAGGVVTGNCAFVSTESVTPETFSEPFSFFMDAAMLGVGVGFDTKGAAAGLRLQRPQGEPSVHVVDDSRLGWVHAVAALLDSYIPAAAGAAKRPISFDTSKVRPAGEPLKTFGGVSSGPGPLEKLFDFIRETLNPLDTLTVTAIVDVFNHIGCCVVAGGIRRTASIAFGDANPEFMDLKNHAVNPHRAAFGWASNNSIFAEIGMDYRDAAPRIASNGEPGFAWLSQMRAFSRLCDAPDNKDRRVSGGNPCLEQSLENYELCTLVETFPARCKNLAEFQRVLKFAYLYAKTVTLVSTHWPQTNRVTLRNRRIGCSVSGLAQLFAKIGHHDTREWLKAGYKTVQAWDEVYSGWLCIPRSVKTTSVKPSGSVSLLAGATPGMHFPISRFYTRRVRMQRGAALVDVLRDRGHTVEDCALGGPTGPTVIVEFPVDAGEGVRTCGDVTMWEQLSIAAMLQEVWADNQVSATITFTAAEAKDISHALDIFQYRLKGISLLPLSTDAYPQMPYEKISEGDYAAAVKRLAAAADSAAGSKTPNAAVAGTLQGPETDAVPERFCDGDSCA